MQDEIWADIPGYDGMYQVSNLGRVKSLPNSQHKATIILKPASGHSGYLFVELRKNGHGRLKRVSRLVLEAFRGDAPAGMHAAHLNGIRADNRLENLAWKSSVENEKDKLVHGTIARGSRSGTSKLTEAQVAKIKALLISGRMRHRDIASMFNVGRTTISSINRGFNWSWL